MTNPTDTDLAQALLPCPFCGSNPEIHRQGNAHTPKRRVVIRCPKCRIERADAAIRKDMEWVEEIAIEHWNRRAHDSRAQPATVADEEIIARCEKAGIRWIPPDGEEGGFPGMFDMARMDEMRRLLSTAPQPQAKRSPVHSIPQRDKLESDRWPLNAR